MSLDLTDPDHPGHGDQSRTVICPACGQEVVNTRFPDHLRGSDGAGCPARHDGEGA